MWIIHFTLLLAVALATHTYLHTWPWPHYADLLLPLLMLLLKFSHLLKLVCAAKYWACLNSITVASHTDSCTVTWWMFALVTCMCRTKKSLCDTSSICIMLLLSFFRNDFMKWRRDCEAQSKEICRRGMSLHTSMHNAFMSYYISSNIRWGFY